MDKIELTKRVKRIRTLEKMYEEYQLSGMKVLRQNVLNTQEQNNIVPIASSYNQSPETAKTETGAEEKIHISGNGITVELPVNILTELLVAAFKGVR